MLKKHSILLSSFLLAATFNLNAQEEMATTKNLQESVCEMKDTSQAMTLSFEPFTGVISGSKVRMRTLPNLDAHVVRETSNGEMFAVVGEKEGYFVVSAPKGMKGYVFRTFILDGMVEGERVNVRLYPDIDAPVVAQLNTGDKVATVVSEANNKWLELDLPDTARFYIAKEYIDKKGSIDLISIIEKKRTEATHLLSAATLFAQAEIQKPFEQIDLDKINEQFNYITREYQDLPTIAEQVAETLSTFQDIYVQKKIAFLENKTDYKPIGYESPANQHERHFQEIGSAASKTFGLTSLASDKDITDKMMAWQPLEESLYHLWATANNERSMDEFYSDQEQEAQVLSGIIEPYTRPVKNRPGDFLLRCDNLPVAFLYSTRINLEKFVGQKVTVMVAPRPNHHFAFPAYFVIAVD